LPAPKTVHPPPRKKKKAKRLEIEAAAIARGTELGKVQAHARKPWQESLKEHLGHWIDNIQPIDLAAISAGTWLVHEIIINSPELQAKASQYVLAGSLLGLSGVFLQAGLDVFMPTKPKEPLPDDWKIWVVSFFVSFIIVRHGGQLLGLMKEGAGSLSTVIGALLA